MGGWFSFGRTSNPGSGDSDEVTLTSLQPIPGADDAPTSGPPSPRPTVPGSPTDGDEDMYRHRYNRPRSYNFTSRYDSNRYYRYSRRHPWYSPDRWRPRASDRDRAFWVDLDDDRDRRSTYPNHRPTEEIEDHKPEVPEEELQTKLHVKSVDLHIEENAKNHHTDEYECIEDRVREIDGSKQKAELVVRRGQEFKMTINFDRPYNIKKNDITLIFNMGDDYKPNKDLSAVFKVNEEGESPYKPSKWGAKLDSKSDKSLTISVFIPASVPVGEWEFSIRTIVDVKDGKDLIWQYNHNEEINVLFNPWCKEDWVYLDDERWRDEAVLNDDGVQYQGNYNRIGVKTWFFGQFEDGILDAAFHLLRKGFGFRAAPGMGNASVVSRLITQMVNSQDDMGVLTGNWSGDYEGGVSPTKWGGSVKILRQYMKDKKPVKYGQCWVFSAVTTTVCRALGIPCRSVTNFASAHNTDQKSLAIDTWWELDENGDHVKVKDDSVWNFHVWNEVWMSRPDLSDSGKWDGWQAIDATPQERSDGVFCCGPAPVKAIKEGEITVGKDGDFIFAEVNADRVEWKQDKKTGIMMEKKRNRSSVGKNISTHLPTGRAYRGASLVNSRANRTERLDLTDTYKYDEGTNKEREVVREAERKFKLMHSGSTWDYLPYAPEAEEEAVEIEVEDPGDVFVGSEFDFVVNVKNTSDNPVSLDSVTLKVFYKTYFDSYTGLAKIEKFDKNGMTLNKGQTETFKLPMELAVTLARPNDGFNFELQTTVLYKTSDESNQDTSDEYIFRLRRPDVMIKGPEKCSRFEEIKVEVAFTNPFRGYLTDCEVGMDGGFYWKDPRTDNFTIGDIGPGDTWKKTLTLKPKLHPRHKKDRELSITFDSRQLKDIIGYYAVEIQ